MKTLKTDKKGQRMLNDGTSIPTDNLPMPAPPSDNPNQKSQSLSSSSHSGRSDQDNVVPLYNGENEINKLIKCLFGLTDLYQLRSRVN